MLGIVVACGQGRDEKLACSTYNSDLLQIHGQHQCTNSLNRRPLLGHFQKIVHARALCFDFRFLG